MRAEHHQTGTNSVQCPTCGTLNGAAEYLAPGKGLYEHTICCRRCGQAIGLSAQALLERIGVSTSPGAGAH